MIFSPTCFQSFYFSYCLHFSITPSCQLNLTQRVLWAGVWRCYCQSIRIQIIHIFYTINPIFYLVACLSASPPHLSNTHTHTPPPCPNRFPSLFAASLPAKLSLPLAFFSPTPATTLCVTPSHSFLLSLPQSLPSFLPPSISSLSSWQDLREEATCGPRGESANSCVHTLSGGLQLFNHSPSSFSFPPSSLCPFHLSLPSLPLPLRCFFTLRLRVSLSPSIPVIPTFNPCLLSLLLFPPLLPILNAFNTLPHSSDHHSINPPPPTHTPTTSAHQLLNSTSLTYSFSFPLSPRVSFSCVSPKIDDSSPQGEWACLKMHEVMRPSFLLLLSLSLSLRNSFFWRQQPPLWVASHWSQAVQRPPPNQTSLSIPSPCQDGWVWHMTISLQTAW